MNEHSSSLLPDQRIWYISYGSNLRQERLMAYITGGSPPGDPTFVHPGCKDKRPPQRILPLVLKHSLYFACYSSERWGGTSAAFITLDARGTPALARGYLITVDQFKDITRQENAGVAEVGELSIDMDSALEEGHSRLMQNGYYDELLYCGDTEGYPMLSITASQNWTEYRCPSLQYLHMIASGLREAHDLSISEVVQYFVKCPGIREHYTVSTLHAALEEE